MSNVRDRRKISIGVSTVLCGMLLGFAGCKAGPAGKLESNVMGGVKRNITIGGKDWKNPVADTAAAQQEGGAHFKHHCAICHGLDGQNTGVPFAAKMSPEVANLTDKDIQEYTDGQMKWIIQNGIGPSGMPGWQGILDDDEMWKIVTFIRHLPAKGSQGIPEIYKEEAEAHEELEKTRDQGAKAAAPKQDESKPHTHTHTHPH